MSHLILFANVLECPVKRTIVPGEKNHNARRKEPQCPAKKQTTVPGERNHSARRKTNHNAAKRTTTPGETNHNARRNEPPQSLRNHRLRGHNAETLLNGQQRELAWSPRRAEPDLLTKFVGLRFLFSMTDTGCLSEGLYNM